MKVKEGVKLTLSHPPGIPMYWSSKRSHSLPPIFKLTATI